MVPMRANGCNGPEASAASPQLTAGSPGSHPFQFNALRSESAAGQIELMVILSIDGAWSSWLVNVIVLVPCRSVIRSRAAAQHAAFPLTATLTGALPETSMTAVRVGELSRWT